MNLSIATPAPKTTKTRAPRGNILNQFTKRGEKWQGWDIEAYLYIGGVATSHDQPEDSEARICNIVLTLSSTKRKTYHSIHMSGTIIGERAEDGSLDWDLTTFALRNQFLSDEPDIAIYSGKDIAGEYQSYEAKWDKGALNLLALQTAQYLINGGHMPYTLHLPCDLKPTAI